MDDENQEPTIWDKAMNYVRGKATAADKVPKKQPQPGPRLDQDKAKSFEDAFKSVK